VDTSWVAHDGKAINVVSPLSRLSNHPRKNRGNQLETYESARELSSRSKAGGSREIARSGMREKETRDPPPA